MSDKTFDEEIGEFSGFSEADYNLTKPMNLTAKMEMRALNLISGENNVGKSLTNKLLWASTFFMNLKIIQKFNSLPDEEMSDEEILETILNNTFDDQTFEGNITYSSRDEIVKVAFYKLEYRLENGKVYDLVIDFPNKAKPMGPIIYLSKEARDFSNIEKYLKIKKLLNLQEIESWNSITALSDYFKIYDILAIESLLQKFNDAKNLINFINQMPGGNELLDDELVDIKMDHEKSELYYIDKNKNQKRLSTLGAGTQSIILMLLSAV